MTFQCQLLTFLSHGFVGKVLEKLPTARESAGRAIRIDWRAEFRHSVG